VKDCFGNELAIGDWVILEWEGKTLKMQVDDMKAGGLAVPIKTDRGTVTGKTPETIFLSCRVTHADTGVPQGQPQARITKVVGPPPEKKLVS
jgi:hypothetical protein